MPSSILPLIAHAAGLASALLLLSVAVRALWWRWQRPDASTQVEGEITQWHAQRGGYMMAYRFTDAVGKTRTSGFFKVVDMTTRPDLSALHTGSRIRLIYCTYAPALSCPAGSEAAYRTYAAIFCGVLGLIAVWQGLQLLPALAFAG